MSVNATGNAIRCDHCGLLTPISIRPDITRATIRHLDGWTATEVNCLGVRVPTRDYCRSCSEAVRCGKCAEWMRLWQAKVSGGVRMCEVCFAAADTDEVPVIVEVPTTSP